MNFRSMIVRLVVIVIVNIIIIILAIIIITFPRDGDGHPLVMIPTFS